MEYDSFEPTLDPQPTKRKRSSILKPAEKRVSKTVSFNDRYIFKEFNADGLLGEDMDITMMDMFEPEQMSNSTLCEEKMSNSTLCEEKMIADNSLIEHSCDMDLTLISQFMDTMPKYNNLEIQGSNYDTSTIYEEKRMSLSSEVSGISSLNSSSIMNSSSIVNSSSIINSSSTVNASSIINSSSTVNANSTINANSTVDASSVINFTNGSILATNDSTLVSKSDSNNYAEISSYNETTLAECSANETLCGAFPDANRSHRSTMSTSGMDTMLHNIEALEECIQKVNEENGIKRRELDDEIEGLFKFYRHIVSKDNKYQFAIRIFGLRHSLWLIIKIDPETYPNEKINLKFAVYKRDRHLYPFPEYSEAVRRCTKEGRPEYLTRFIINAQKFRRFLRCIDYRKPN